MIVQEPVIKVGLLENADRIDGVFEGGYRLHEEHTLNGTFDVQCSAGEITIGDGTGKPIAHGTTIICRAVPGSRCRIRNVTIGRKFHWERKEEQVFGGDIIFRSQTNDTLMVINEIPLEEYLASVISSEMSASAPSDFLQAHSIISRSWLLAMVGKKHLPKPRDTRGADRPDEECVRWYDREEHSVYDVCADDHCQRYHGLSRIRSHNVLSAVQKTRGVVLVYGNTICDARYSKCCGGWTEEFESAWEPTHIPYLTGINDSAIDRNPLTNEKEVSEWILSAPDAYCRTTDDSILRCILPSFDQETKDFYRWQVSYAREELEGIIKEKSGIDFGTLTDLIPLQRGSSGRIVRLKIVGTDRTFIVGKELEIRRWLSKSHLRSSAFVVETDRGDGGIPGKFTIRGAGWGHGVGLCQIGAAVMAMKGESTEKILRHYYRDAVLRTLY